MIPNGFNAEVSWAVCADAGIQTGTEIDLVGDHSARGWSERPDDPGGGRGSPDPSCHGQGPPWPVAPDQPIGLRRPGKRVRRQRTRPGSAGRLSRRAGKGHPIAAPDVKPADFTPRPANGETDQQIIIPIRTSGLVLGENASVAGASADQEGAEPVRERPLRHLSDRGRVERRSKVQATSVAPNRGDLEGTREPSAEPGRQRRRIDREAGHGIGVEGAGDAAQMHADPNRHAPSTKTRFWSAAPPRT